MKKLQFVILLLLSSFLLSQSWSQNNNSFNRPSRKIYEDLSKKKEEEINRDMGNIKRIVNQTGSIVTQLQEENDEDDIKQNIGGPGAPGEPIPIDKYKGLLFLLGLIIIIYKKKLMKFE
jgi:hypothetical protein